MDPLSLLLFVILIFLSMFFSASETAFTSVPMHKASVFLKEKKAEQSHSISLNSS